jgi:predicted metal-dependent hydrolase
MKIMEKIKFMAEGCESEIKVVKSFRRTICLEVRQSEVILRIPRRLSDDERDRFLQNHAAWLAKKLRQRDESDGAHEHDGGDENNGANELGGIDRSDGANEHDGSDSSNGANEHDGSDSSNGANEHDGSDSSDGAYQGDSSISTPHGFPIYTELTPKDKENLKHYFEERVAYHAQIMGVTYGRVTVRDQRTRWGSCSSKGNLNFNYRLCYMPRELMDYVIIHELAHRRHMNHSGKFWNEVEKYCPDYRERVEVLKHIKI